jgi:hypothetical protein
MDADSSLEIHVEYDPEEEVRPRAHSFIRLLPADSQTDAACAEPATVKTAAPDGLAFLANDQLNFTVSVLHLKRLVENERGALADRIGDLEDVRDALESVLGSGSVGPLLRAGAPLAAYVKGLHLFCGAAAEAFEEALTASRRDLKPCAWRLAEATHFYFDGLTHAVRLDLMKQRLAPNRDLAHALEELFFAAAYFHDHIAKLTRPG